MPDPTIEAQIFRSACVNLVAFVILYYDYFLTLSAEVEYFWRSRSISWASAFFFLNRYLVLFGHIPVMFQYFWVNSRGSSAKVCSVLASYHQYFAVTTQIIVGIVLIIRTYALYDRNIRVLLFICVSALGVIAVGVWTVIAGGGFKHEEVLVQVGCVPPTNRIDADRLAIAWLANLIFDILIFCMTLYKSLRKNRGGDRTLINVLLRDGSIYFGIMALVGLANILTFRLLLEYERGFLTSFANVLSSTMISRLMLNLRDPKLRLRYPRMPDSSRTIQNATTNYPILSTVLEFNTISEPATIHEE